MDQQVKRSRRLLRPCTQQDVPEELIQYIQSLLPVEEAARTCVLSKSWLHGWSTIPTLRFLQSVKYLTGQQKANYIKLIDDTLTRYLSENIPIINFHLHFGIENSDSAYCLAENWIRPVASKRCLKELYLKIWFAISLPFTMPDEIFSGENLNKLSVTDQGLVSYSVFISSTSNPVIKCVNLRVLELINVHITQELLDNLFSTCSLLRKVKLSLPDGVMMTTKVQNLGHLRILKVLSVQPGHILEIYNVPSLRQFSYDTSMARGLKPQSFKTDLLVHVRKLFLAGVIVDDAFLDIINSKFPCLDSLTLISNHCLIETLDIRSVLLTRLRIRVWVLGILLSIRVYAPKLHYFRYTGPELESLFFPAITPEKIHLRLELRKPVVTSFFLKLREVLNFRTNFKIKITVRIPEKVVPFDIDVNDVRRRFPIAATNVQKIYFSLPDESFWERSQFFDAFFSICHPKYVKAHQFRACDTWQIKHFWKKIVTGMMERKTYWRVLEDIEIKHPFDGKWKTLTRFWISFPEQDRVKFRLTWCSP